MRRPTYWEDWRGRYWLWAAPGVLSASCTDLDCLWPTYITHTTEGWSWHHDHDHDVAHRGWWRHWQEAADDAVTAGHARPTT